MNKPFTTDISSTVVQHLSHGMDAAAVYSVIYTFNGVSRHVSLQGVAQEPPSPLYSRRLQKVTKCAVQFGLAGVVRVNRVCSTAVLSPLNRWEGPLPCQRPATRMIPFRRIRPGTSIRWA